MVKARSIGSKWAQRARIQIDLNDMEEILSSTDGISCSSLLSILQEAETMAINEDDSSPATCGSPAN
jgi:hypothetical protein